VASSCVAVPAALRESIDKSPFLWYNRRIIVYVREVVKHEGLGCSEWLSDVGFCGLRHERRMPWVLIRKI